jgi:antitoxin CptB
MTPSTPRDDDPEFVKRRMLRFRSWHRGTKEADLMLGSFCDSHLAGFTPEQLDRYAELLEQPDYLIYDWAVGRQPVPAEFDTDVMAMLKGHSFVDAQYPDHDQ